MEIKEYNIWSNEHMSWWGPNEFGYTNIRANAGKYYSHKAEKIVADAKLGWDGKGHPPEVMVEINPTKDPYRGLNNPDKLRHLADKYLTKTECRAMLYEVARQIELDKYDTESLKAELDDLYEIHREDYIT